ncbi:unnamed protein product [Ectocarpus sp. 12 AP-2014]
MDSARGSNGIPPDPAAAAAGATPSPSGTSRPVTPASEQRTGPHWWKSQVPPPPPPKDGDNSLNDGSTAATNGAEEAGEERRFWRTAYSPDEFASVRRASERVTLNLSGTSFMTTRDTLARNPHTYFAAMLRMQPPTTPGSTSVRSGSTSSASAAAEEESSGSGGTTNGGTPAAAGGGGGGSSSSASDGVEFFIDRDPTHFRHILNYLRDSYIGLESFGKEDLHFLEELSHEAQFFNIAGLCSDISRRMSDIARQHREGPSGDKDFRLVQCSTGQIQDLFHEWVIEKNYEFECMQIVGDTAYIVLGRRVSRGELALVERLMKT